MKIIVLIKHTPDTETQIVIKADGKQLDHAVTKFIVNPYDDYAIEEALKLKEKHGGEVVIACFGPTGARESIFKGLAMGADRGLLIDSNGWEDADSLVVAKILHAVVSKEACDLVLCGKQAIDDDNMHVGVMLSEFLEWPHVNVVSKLQIEGSKATIEREIEGGQVEVYEARLPLVIGAHKSLNTPRYTSLPGIMKAKKKPLDTKTPSDFGIDNSALKALQQVQVHSYTYPPSKPKGKIFQGQPVEAMVDEVVKLLREEAKVI